MGIFGAGGSQSVTDKPHQETKASVWGIDVEDDRCW
jgi:hypothetical protein